MIYKIKEKNLKYYKNKFEEIGCKRKKNLENTVIKCNNIVYNLFNNSIYYNIIVRFVSIDIDNIMIDKDVDIDM